MSTMIRSACSTGEFNDPLKGCQLCSWIQSPYQEILCPCEPSRDAVIGCKSSAQGNNICRPRTDALDECARRGYTSSRAPGTTAAAGSMAALTIASVSSSSTTIAAGESLLSRLTTVSSIGNTSSSASSDASHVLALGVSLGVIFVVLFVVIGALLYKTRLRRKMRHRQTIKIDVDEREPLDISRKWIVVEAATNRLSVNGALNPQVVIVNEKTPTVDPNPSCVVKNYNVIVKDSHFMQVGSGNIMTVGERVASAIGSAHESDNEDEAHMFYSGDLEASGHMTVSGSLNGLAPGGEFAFYQTVQGYTSDLREEGNARPTNAENSDTWEMRAESFASRGFSSIHSGEEHHKSSSGSLQPAEVGFLPSRNSVAGLSERSEELSGSRHRGYESAATDNSHMPAENADYSSQAMAASSEPPPASLPAEGTERKSSFEPTYSPPYDKECRTPSVSSHSALPSSSLSNSWHDSVDGVGDKESLSLPTPALQSVSASKLESLASLSELPTREAVQNSDGESNLPTTTDTLRLLSVIRN